MFVFGVLSFSYDKINMFFVLKIERKIDFVKVDQYRKIYGKYLQLLFTSLDRAVNQFFYPSVYCI